VSAKPCSSSELIISRFAWKATGDGAWVGRPPIASPEGGLRRHIARTSSAKLPEQNEETVLVVWRQIRPAPPGLQRQVTNFAALIGRESIPVFPTLRVQPQDRGEDSAPWDFPHGSDRLQDPRWHRCHPGYPEPGTSNGDGFPSRANERTRPRRAREMCALEIADGSDDRASRELGEVLLALSALRCLGLERGRPACLLPAYGRFSSSAGHGFMYETRWPRLGQWIPTPTNRAPSARSRSRRNEDTARARIRKLRLRLLLRRRRTPDLAAGHRTS